MEINNGYLKARMEVIQTLMAGEESTEKSNDKVLLRNGVFPTNLNEQELVLAELKRKNYSDSPLSFRELSSYNNWFVLHPEKMAGKEIITSSRTFPLSIKGTKEDILKTVLIEKKENVNQDSFELEALALEVELELLEFKTLNGTQKPILR